MDHPLFFYPYKLIWEVFMKRVIKNESLKFAFIKLSIVIRRKIYMYVDM